MNGADGRIRVGRVSGVYGVKGWVRIFSETEPRDAITGFPRLWMKRADGWELAEVEGGRAHGPGVVIKFAGVADRDAAYGLMGSDLAIERDWLPPAEEGEYYWADLQGLSVEHVDGTALGTVTGFMETGANDVMIVGGERERLIPWVQGLYVLEVDLADGRIRVDWDPEY